MIRLLAHLLLLAIAAGGGAMAVPATAEPPQHLPLVKADFPVCVTVKPGTIEPEKRADDLYPRRKDVA